jgi:predicted AAA+ superfamily ATPase
MISRIITKQIINDLKPGHVTVLFGARRTGKTVMMEQIQKMMSDKKILFLHGEDFDVAEALSSQRQEILKNLVSGYDFLFLDEAQNIPGIGKNLKLLVDTQKQTGVFVTGSASFELKNQIGEPLVGRSKFFHLHPFLLSEIADNYIDARRKLSQILVYGTYPQIFLADNLASKREILENIRNGYLLRDILQLDNLKDSIFIINLLKNIAYQVGNDISYNELANNLKTTVKTIQRYLEILEKAFVIFRLYGFSRNLRKEISKSPRFYFWDNGIRNVIISNTNPLDSRDDAGRLWENFCIAERVKRSLYKRDFANHYFWRTYDQQEIDLIEEAEGIISGYEMKWGDKSARVPKAFADNYPDASFHFINKENFPDYLFFD